MINVLNLIKNNGSFEKPLKAKEIRKRTGLNKRKLEEAIESLRKSGHPIVARKSQPSGYYIPKNEHERKSGLATYKQQIITSLKNVKYIEKVDLGDYWGNNSQEDN